VHTKRQSEHSTGAQSLAATGLDYSSLIPVSFTTLPQRAISLTM
jgi:hypothetical protein